MKCVLTTRKCVLTTRVALISLLIVIGSFSCISGSSRNPEPRQPIDAIQKIIEGMIGIEASERWVELINRIGTANLPPSATIFFPTGKDVSLGSKQWAMDPQVIRYHIVPRAISYWQLSKHAAADHLIPTLLPYKSINVTGDTICKVISVDNVPITHPEMFHDGSIAIHGVSTLLTNHSLNDNDSLTKPSPPQAQPHNEDDDGFQPLISPQAFPFEMSTGTIPSPPSIALSAPAPQPSASGGSSIKQVSIALLVGVWAVLLS